MHTLGDTFRRLWLTGLLLIVLSDWSVGQSPRPDSGFHIDPGVWLSIDSMCHEQMQVGHFPGLAVAIASPRTDIWRRGYGFADLENYTPVDPVNHLFRIGSVSKSVTASALGRLVEKRKLDVDLPIGHYFPSLPADKHALTLRQIGGHLGGIRHYKGLEFLSALRYEDVLAPLEVFIHDTLLHAPGTAYHYSTYGWTLISAVMEQAIGKPFTAIIREEVSDPLHLKDLKPDHPDSTQFHRTTFYEFRNDAHVVSPAVDNSNKWAGGGYLCSAADLARYGYAHVKNKYLKQETLAIFMSPQQMTNGEKTTYGIGFSTGTDKKGRTWFGHSGGSVGGTSMLLIYPEYDLVVVTLVNMSGARMNELAWRIADELLEGN